MKSKTENVIIEVKNAKKIYRMGSERICAVDNASFIIKKGEFCCLFGASGSGKSTLLNLMAGIEKLTSGQIIIKGKNIHKMSEKSLAKFRQRNLGFVFQSYNLLNSMTALENVELPLVFQHMNKKKRKKLSKDILVKVGLGPRMKHKPKEMSGGQQQRVGIARAFVGNPEIVFADEPTGNLDSKTSKEVMNLIKDMAKKNNQTIVMVTHDRGMAEYADKIIHILDGKVERIEIPSDEVQTKQEEILTEPVDVPVSQENTQEDIPAQDIITEKSAIEEIADLTEETAASEDKEDLITQAPYQRNSPDEVES